MSLMGGSSLSEDSETSTVPALSLPSSKRSRATSESDLYSMSINI